MKSTLLSVTKYGLLMGIGFCLYTTIMWLSKLDTTYLYIGQYLDMAIIILPIVIISKSINEKNKQVSVKFWERTAIAVYVGLISYAIYQPFLYSYHHFINPNWFDAVLSLKKSSLIATKMSSIEIGQILNKMIENNLVQDKMFSFSSFISSVIILPFFISLLSLIFIRKTSK